MANTAVAFGVMLIGLGLIGYFSTGSTSPTALIPAGFGLILLLLGFLARDPDKTKHAMHGAALLAVLGVLGSGRGLPKILPLLAGEPVDRPAAVIAQAIMAMLMLIFLVLCIQSFRTARRSRIA
ncbi:MAG: hypothetical protein WKF37_15910 [Bryobacteraceae bacterium]